MTRDTGGAQCVHTADPCNKVGFAVVCTVSDDRGDGAGDLLERRADQGGIARLGGGQLGGEDLAAVGIGREVECTATIRMVARIASLEDAPEPEPVAS